MTVDEVMDLAYAYGLEAYEGNEEERYTSAWNDLRSAIETLLRKRTEECAKVCEEMPLYIGKRTGAVMPVHKEDCADAIRARFLADEKEPDHGADNT